MENGKITNTFYFTKKRNTEYIQQRSKAQIPDRELLLSRTSTRGVTADWTWGTQGSRSWQGHPEVLRGEVWHLHLHLLSIFPICEEEHRQAGWCWGWQRSLAPPGAAPVEGQKPLQLSCHSSDCWLCPCFLGAGVSQHGTRFSWRLSLVSSSVGWWEALPGRMKEQISVLWLDAGTTARGGASPACWLKFTAPSQPKEAILCVGMDPRGANIPANVELPLQHRRAGSSPQTLK